MAEQVREIDVDVEAGFRNESPSVKLWNLDFPTWKARLACSLVERWGMVAGAPDGEDSTGRQKVKIVEPADLVERACATANLLVDACRARGWVDRLPTKAEAMKMVPADETKK